MTVHVPRRPDWGCDSCGAPWPCGEARAGLLSDAGGSPVTLSLWMAGYLVEAIDDLPDVRAGVLRDQIMGWLPE